MSRFEQFMQLSEEERLQKVEQTLSNMQELSLTLKQQVMEHAKASGKILEAMQELQNSPEFKNMLQTIKQAIPEE